MRARVEDNGLVLCAFAANNAVLLTWNVVDTSVLEGVLGFAVEKQDLHSNKKYFLFASKPFPSITSESTSTEAKHPSTTLSSPIQAFSWSDYSAQSGVEYEYTIYPMKGTPENLQRHFGVSIRIQTEGPLDSRHSVFFNRGVAGSQGYTRKFGSSKPEEVPERAAYKWLSNGLEEALFSFMAQAKDSSYSLRVAAYEFCYEPLLLALKEAHERQVDVKIVVDWKIKKDGSFKTVKNGLDHVEESFHAIEATKLPWDLIIKRQAGTSFISHNKFLVLLHNNEPQEVWTGSTNFTEGGIFGQSNNGHIIRDSDIAAQFLEYWKRLAEDPNPKELRKSNVEATPIPMQVAPNSTYLLFSPRESDDALEFYTELLTRARQAICFTAAFGVNDHFTKVLQEPSNILRYILLEKTDKKISPLIKHACNRIAVGSVLDQEAAALLGVLPEQVTGLNDHVSYIHTKYLLIDPFSDDPIVVCGSANFSRASNVNNDENMMIVRGDTRLADQYAVNFFRLWRHFEYRHRVKKGLILEKDKYLIPDVSWQDDYFTPSSIGEQERNIFCPLSGSDAPIEPIEIDLSAIKRHRPTPVERKPLSKKEDRFCTMKDGKLIVVFGYNKSLVEQIKVIPAADRLWNSEAKQWELQVSDESKATIKQFLEANHFVLDEQSISIL